MNVLHVNEHITHKGGVETYLFDLLPRLEEQGVSSVLAYAEGTPSLHKETRHVPSLGTVGFQAEEQARSHMENVLREEDPDLVHIHNVQNVGALQASLQRRPTIVTTHDYRWVCPANTFFHRRPQEVCTRTCGVGCLAVTLAKRCVSPRPQYGAYFYRRAKWGIENADRFAQVIAPSQKAAERYKDAGYENADISVLPYFCALQPAEVPRPLPDPPTITYLGRIAPNKGHEYFIEALGQLSSPVQGHIVGGMSDAVAANLERLAERAGCADRLTLQGWASRAEVVDLLDRTSVFVFPSLWPETLGIVGIEALSRGVPVVASDLGGVEEWCHEGKTGYRVPPKDPDAIANRVDRLLRDPQRLKSFGWRGLDLVRTKFEPARHVRSLLHVYQEARAARRDIAHA